MEFRRGRLIDHIHLRAADFPASRRFYRALAGVLGIEPTIDSETVFCVDELYIDAADGPTSRVHLAFQAKDHAMVEAFHAAGLDHGGRDNGKPGERPYHPGYFAAFLLDPDGNNVEAVHHGASTRSAADVVITPAAG